MSYGLKYTLTFRDSTQISYSGALGALWKINIYQNGYNGSSSSVIGTDSPVTLNYKKQDLISPLCGSELTLSLMAMSNNQYDEFLTAEPLQYYVDLLKSTNNGSSYSTYWSGVNTTDTYTESYSSAPYPINLKFNDGLGELQWHRYENSGILFDGVEQIIQVINNIMTFLPYQKNVREIINIRADGMNDGLGLLEQLYLSDFAFQEVGSDGIIHGINCNKLLGNILTSLNCRMYQSNNKWYIERIYERTQNSLHYYDYIMTGGVLVANTMTNSGSGTENKVIAIDNATFPKIVQGSELAITKKQPVLAYKFNTSAYSDVQLINNPYFENTPTSTYKNPSGSTVGKPLPLRWDRQAGLAATGGDQILIINSYNSDPRYQTAYCFGSAAIAAQLAQLNSTPGWWVTNLGLFPSTYGVHSVLRTGDTYSQPCIYIDMTNGTLSLDFQVYLRITVTVVAGSFSSGDAYTAANALISGLSVRPFFQMSFTNTSGGHNNAYGDLTTNTWNTASTSTFSLNQLISPVGLLQNWYPDYGPSAYPISFNQLGTMLMTASNKGTGGSFDLIFRVEESNTSNLSALLDTTGLFAFDLKAYPPWYDPSGVNKLAPKVSWVVADYGLNAIDIQYKEQANSAAPFIGFYSTPDEDNRWNELDVSPMFGDSITNGYPGVFRTSSGNMTGTWHEIGHGYSFNTSTSAADPGTGKLSMNNTTAALVTHIYLNVTDSNSINDSAWLSTMLIGSILIVGDGTNTVVFTVNSVTGHSTYYDVSVTYLNNTGSFPFSSGDALYAVYAGIILADILFAKYIQICGNYRHNLKAKILGTVDYWQTVQDEDGRNYILLGHQLNIKSGQITSDMEEMSDTQLSIIHTIGPGVGAFSSATSAVKTGIGTAVLGLKTTTAVTKSSTVTAITSYPL